MAVRKSKAKNAARTSGATRPAARSKAPPKKSPAARDTGQSAHSRDDWRGEILAEIRRLIGTADPEVVEERKWIKPSNPAGVPVWSHAGIICTGETYRQVVKVTFARGAFLEDPQGLFNSSLEGNTRRAIDLREGEKLDARAFQDLIGAAVAENHRSKAGSSRARSQARTKPAESSKESKPARKKAALPRARAGEKVVFLSGGNPQIAKGDGDAPVQAYLAAMPGWKGPLGKRLDALIQKHVPDVKKAVRWNSPFYGVDGRGWFLSFHVFTRYLKVTFFAGLSLRPIPPGGTPKSQEARWIDIYESDEFDENQMAMWIKQAAALPGWVP
jgi:hypothetical protein